MRAETPSGTAKLIAAATILLASERDEANPVPEDAEKLCRLFLSRGFSDRALALSAGFPPTRGLFRLLEAATLPGIIAHYWNRKHWIERRCRDAIRDGFMSEWSDGSSGFRPESRLVQSWLKWRGEPFMWALRPAVMPDFVATLGFRFIEMALTRELTAVTSALDDENLVICER